MMKNILIAGVGGQGIVLASKLIAKAAMEKGMFVRTSETIGMSQRGGSVVSHIRIGEDVCSPLIPKHAAHVIIGFEPAEALRHLLYLKEGGTVIVSKNAIKPVTDSLSKTDYNGDEMLTFLRERVAHVLVVDPENIFQLCGSSKVLNTALLGASAAAGVLGITPEEFEKAIRETVKEKYIDMNLKALQAGAAMIKE